VKQEYGWLFLPITSFCGLGVVLGKWKIHFALWNFLEFFSNIFDLCLVESADV
jgi:hypothetical protein